MTRFELLSGRENPMLSNAYGSGTCQYPYGGVEEGGKGEAESSGIWYNISQLLSHSIWDERGSRSTYYSFRRFDVRSGFRREYDTPTSLSEAVDLSRIGLGSLSAGTGGEFVDRVGE